MIGIHSGCSKWAELEAAQQVIELELMHIESEILAEQEALARIETQVCILERANRQAA